MANLNLLPRQLNTRDKIKLEVRAATQAVMEELAFNEHFCNGVVAAGKTYWREQCQEWYRRAGVPCSDEIANAVYEFACHMVRYRYRAEQSQMSSQAIAKLALDHTEEIAPALSDEQIIDSLEIDSSGTSDDARRQLYGRDGSAERALDEMKEQMKRRLRNGDNPFPTRPEEIN
jgi:hypothetical protein